MIDLAAIPPDVPGFLDGLKRSGALTGWQVRRLADRWGALPDDWASDPYLRQVAEHTRACIDRERPRHHDPNPSQKEQVHA